MSELRELYQSMILEHGRRPRNRGCPEGANRHARGHNPLCGDEITLHLRLEDGMIRDVGFEGTGCAISQASASLMTEAVKGRSLAEVEDLFERFHELVAGEKPPANPEELGKLAVFSGVREFPVRVKCATLPWHTLREAAFGEGRVVRTE